MAEGDDLKFQVRPATKRAGERGKDRRHEDEHAGDTSAADAKTPDFSAHLEF